MLRVAYVASFLLLAMFCGLLSSSRLWPTWSTLTGRHVEPIPVTVTEDLSVAEPTILPRITAQSASTQTVSIPPVMIALQAGAPTGLPAVVTPSASEGQIASQRPIVVRPPRMPTAAIPAVLRVPSGQGPFPAVILLHGCGGPFTGMPDWAYRLNAWGYAALMPDSMTPRGVTTVCEPADQPLVTPWDRVGDIGAAVLWLRARAEIDPDRIAVLGLSHGGMTAALATQTPYAGMRLRAAIDYYGPCVEPRLHGTVPLLVLAGEADDWGNPAAYCRDYGKNLRPGQIFELHTYPGVYHAFDGGSAIPTRHYGHILQHNQAAAEDSFIRVRAFLDRWVRP